MRKKRGDANTLWIVIAAVLCNSFSLFTGN